jgi:hypothetical protein
VAGAAHGLPYHHAAQLAAILERFAEAVE